MTKPTPKELIDIIISEAQECEQDNPLQYL